jgi:hypothetical protein
MSSSNDPRARELTRLKLALATFARQLDAFEQRAHGLLRSIGQPEDDGPPSRGSLKGEKLAGQ